MRTRRRHRLARAPTPRRAQVQHNRIEALEARRLLASIFFDGGGGDGLWNNPANWHGHMVPTAQDDVSIGYEFDVTLAGTPGAARTLMMGTSATLNVQTGLTLGASSYAQIGTTFNLQPGGTLDGPGDLNLLGAFHWTGGAMQGEGRTIAAYGGQAQVTGVEFKELSRTLRIEQSAQIEVGEVRFDGGTLEIDPRATVLLDRAQLTSAGGINRIDNAGKINTAGFIVSIDVPLFHTGVAEIHSNLDLVGGGSATGSFEMAMAGNRMFVGASGYRFDAGSSIFGPGSHLWISGGTTTIADAASLVAITVSGGDLTLEDKVDVSGGTLVEGSGILRLEGAVSNLTTIQVETGGKIMLAGDGTHVLRTTYPGITEQGFLDVGREAVIFDYPPGYSSLFDVRGKITSGYFDGAWVGAGICSALAGSTGAALGYGEASALFTQFPATFMGQAVDDTSILVRYTRWGDANLDGTVDLKDFNRLAGSFGATDAYWSQGEFSYDSSVTLKDFNLLAGNFGQSVEPVATEVDEVAELLA